MLIIRFARRGRKKQAFFDLVAAEKSRPVQKKFIAKLGYYNPLSESGKGEFIFDADKVKTYIQNGAQVSQTVARLLVKNGVKEAGKFVEQRVTKPKKEEPKPEVVEEPPAEEAAAEAPTEESEAPKEDAPAAEASEDKKEDAEKAA